MLIVIIIIDRLIINKKSIIYFIINIEVIPKARADKRKDFIYDLNSASLISIGKIGSHI